jgi:hypothetical protein
VSLADGRTVDVHYDQLTPIQERPPTASLPQWKGASATLVVEHTIYAAVVGSDVDRVVSAGAHSDVRAIFQAPTSSFWLLSKPPKHVAGPGHNWFSWEVERFCEQALKANPTYLELLWSPLPIWVNDAGQELLDLRGAFLSQAIFPAYSTHVLSALKKLTDSDWQPAQRRWEQVAHLFRMVMEGTALLRTGEAGEFGGEHHERLETIRSGQASWEQVESWSVELQRELEAASAATFLPADPDVERVNAWLHNLRSRDAESAE